MPITIKGPITFGRKTGMTSLLEKIKREEISLPFNGDNIKVGENQHLVGDLKPARARQLKQAEEKKANDDVVDDGKKEKPTVKPTVRRRRK